jgi:plastocyanin
MLFGGSFGSLLGVASPSLADEHLRSQSSCPRSGRRVYRAGTPDVRVGLAACTTWRRQSVKHHTYLKLAGAGILVFGVLALAGCSGGASSGGTGTGSSSAPSGAGTSSSGTTITEQNFAFSPANVTVKAGDTVTFTNNDSAPHNVKIDGKELGVQQPGESKTWTAATLTAASFIPP